MVKTKKRGKYRTKFSPHYEPFGAGWEVNKERLERIASRILTPDEVTFFRWNGRNLTPREYTKEVERLGGFDPQPRFFHDFYGSPPKNHEEGLPSPTLRRLDVLPTGERRWEQLRPDATQEEYEAVAQFRKERRKNFRNANGKLDLKALKQFNQILAKDSLGEDRETVRRFRNEESRLAMQRLRAEREKTNESRYIG